MKLIENQQDPCRQQASQPLLLTIRDTQARLGGISAPTVYKMVKKGDLKLVKIGARSLITAESIFRVALGGKD